MIHKVGCVMLECDNCKETYECGHSGFSIFVDESGAKDYASDDDWEMNHESGKHFCDKCYHYDEDDNFILNNSRTKPLTNI